MKMELQEPSIQSVFLEMRRGDMLLATGTGFFAACHLGTALVTNRHNVTGRDQVSNQPLAAHGGIPDRLTIWQPLKPAPNVGQLWRAETYRLYNDDDQPNWREHPTLGREADVVALPIEPGPDAMVRPYSLAEPSNGLLLMPGDIVNVIGFPFGLTAGGRLAVWSTGFLATEPNLDYDYVPIFLVDCRSRKGQSGSPVIAFRNGGSLRMKDGSTFVMLSPYLEFLGIYSGRVHAESDLGKVWKRSVVAELCASL